MCNPPLTSKVAPVTKLDKSDARNRQAPATSLGSAKRRSGIVAHIWFNCASLMSFSMPVCAMAGQMTFALMPSGPNSRAIDRVRLITPPLAEA